MREIKFRCWDKEKMKMIYPNSQELIIVSTNGVGCDSEAYVIMQYTGLKDKNGTEIYEGDVIRTICLLAGEQEEEYPVVFYNGSWCLQGEDYGSFFSPLSEFKQNELQVAGNIYEGYILSWFRDPKFKKEV